MAQYQIEPIWVTPLELSRRTGISVQTLANQRHQRRGFSYSKRGKSVLYFWPDVHAALESEKIQPEQRN